MSSVEFGIDAEGFEELDNKLKLLVPMIRGQKGFAQNPLRNATRKAAKVVMEQAITNARAIDDPETKDTKIFENIAMRPISVKDRDIVTAAGDSLEGYHIGVKYKSKKSPFAVHWGFLELGTDEIAAQPYLRPAAESKAREAVEVFSSELRKSLDRIAAKLKRQGGLLNSQVSRP